MGRLRLNSLGVYAHSNEFVGIVHHYVGIQTAQRATYTQKTAIRVTSARHEWFQADSVIPL